MAADIEAYLASDVDFPARHGGSVLARGRAQRRRPQGLSRLAMLGRDLARARNSRRACARTPTVAVIPSVARPTEASLVLKGSDLMGARGGRGNHRGLLLRARGRADQSRPLRRRSAVYAERAGTARHSPPRLSRSRIQRRIPRGDPRARRRRRQRGRVLQLGSRARRESRMDRRGTRCAQERGVIEPLFLTQSRGDPIGRESSAERE